MKNVCIMKGNICDIICQINDEWTIEDSIFIGYQKDAKYVPSWVWGSWKDNGDGSWTDPSGWLWDQEGYTTKDCPTARTPGYEGDWPRVRPSEEPSDTPEE